MKITTDHKPRPILYWQELTKKEKADFDWMDEEDQEGLNFFRYKKRVYFLGDFMRTDIEGYHGASSDSYFSGILINLSNCGEAVYPATYRS